MLTTQIFRSTKYIYDNFVQVWWLTKDRRKWVYRHYPQMVQVTKTKETEFEEFKEERIQRINDDWSTPLETFRKYQEANITLNMYFVDSPLMFSYAWCLGFQSVTTSNCKVLSSQTSNPLYDVSVLICSLCIIGANW